MSCAEEQTRSPKPLRRLIRTPGILFVAVFIACSAPTGRAQAQAQSPATPGQTVPSQAAPNPAVPAVKPKDATPELSEKQKKQDAQMQERKAQLAADTAKLLELANDLKAEMDKSSKDTLSIGVIKKADQVEKLAHKVREEMKATMGN
jgi:uncharacterized iron-regulated membrane protein